MALQWCDIGSEYVSGARLWIDTTSGKVIIKPNQNYADSKRDDAFEYEKYVISWYKDYKEILTFLKKQEEERNRTSQQNWQLETVKAVRQIDPRLTIDFSAGSVNVSDGKEENLNSKKKES